MRASTAEERIVVLAPLGRDASAVAEILNANGFAAVAVASPQACLTLLEEGVGAMVLTEEALAMEKAGDLLTKLDRQPAWSELPIVMLTAGGESRVNNLRELTSSPVTLLERPMAKVTLVRALEVAIRARRRQYQVRNLLEQQERQKIELQESEERFRTMANGLPLTIWVHDADGVQQFVNHTFCEFFGVSAEEMTGDRWQQLVHPDDVEAYAAEFANCTRLRQPFTREARVRRIDGQWRWVQSWARPRMSDAGEFLGMVGASADITERKQAEAELARQAVELAELNRTLDERVRERSEQLHELNLELTRTEHRERTRLAQVLHDGLQQFLVAARMHAELLGVAHNVADRRDHCQRLGRLLNEAIAASRSLTFELSPPALQEEGLVPALQWLAKWVHEKHQFTVELALTQGAEIEDPAQRLILFQCVRELILNAIKHSGTRSAMIKMWRATEDETVCLEVSDQGAGFDPDLQQHNQSFGLVSIRQRLALIGGRMEVTSSPGQGTRATLCMPAKLQSEPESGGMTSDSSVVPQVRLCEIRTSATPGGKRVRVLLADDHQVVREGLAEVLRKQADFDLVGEAADGLEVLELALTLKPDVVLMDVHMPQLDGIEATRRLLEAQPELRIIGLSSYDDMIEGNAMRKAGSVAYLTKGQPASRLLSTIRKVAGLVE